MKIFTEYSEYKIKKFLREYKVLCSAVAVALVLVLLLLLTLHRHQFGEWERYLDPTCSMVGSDRRYCSCGEYESKFVDRLPHTEGYWEITEDGTVRTLTCSVCGFPMRTEKEPEHAHKWSDWTVNVDATCEDKGTEIRGCSCGLTEKRDISSIGHSFSNWTLEYESGCGVSGKSTRVCSNCSKVEEMEYPPLEHVELPPNIVGTEIRYYCELCSVLIRCEEMRASVGLEIVDGVVIGIGACTDASIVIPSEHDGVAVTAIGEGAFKNQTHLVSVILPQSVNVIGDSAFLGCTGLRDMDLEFVERIEADAFAFCDNLVSVRLGTPLKYIGRWVFEYSNSLSSIYYGGDADAWLAIEKHRDWSKYAPDGFTLEYINR